MFEYENDLLIVDEMIYDPSLPNASVVRINDNHYMILNANARKPINESSLRPYKKKVNKDWMRMDQNYEYLFLGMIPRGGFNVELGRPITSEEFKIYVKNIILRMKKYRRNLKIRLAVFMVGMQKI